MEDVYLLTKKLGFQEALTASGNKIIQQYVTEKRCNLGTAREKYSHLFFLNLYHKIARNQRIWIYKMFGIQNNR